MKICRKGLHQFSGKRCKECHRVCKTAWKELNSEREKANMKAWKEANKDKIKAWYEANKEVCKANNKAWKEANSEQEKANQKAYQKANQDKCNAHSAKRRSKKLNATPTWLTKEHFKQIEAFYTNAKELEQQTGVKYHVDHIVPLQGETVSGLHVPWNLQVIEAYGPNGNISKSNKLIEV